jgi:hypothetical protein
MNAPGKRPSVLFSIAKWIIIFVIFFPVLSNTEMWEKINKTKDLSLLINPDSWKNFPGFIKGTGDFFTHLPWQILAFFLIIAIIPAVYYYRLNKRIKYLKYYGQQITADIIEISKDQSTKINGSPVYRIHLSWKNPSDSFTYDFKSRMFLYHPGPYIKGKTLPVWIEQNNPNNYWVDVTEIK